jgi:hypothetical protein
LRLIPEPAVRKGNIDGGLTNNNANDDLELMSPEQKKVYYEPLWTALHEMLRIYHPKGNPNPNLIARVINLGARVFENDWARRLRESPFLLAHFERDQFGGVVIPRTKALALVRSLTPVFCSSDSLQNLLRDLTTCQRLIDKIDDRDGAKQIEARHLVRMIVPRIASQFDGIDLKFPRFVFMQECLPLLQTDALTDRRKLSHYIRYVAGLVRDASSGGETEQDLQEATKALLDGDSTRTKEVKEQPTPVKGLPLGTKWGNVTLIFKNCAKEGSIYTSETVEVYVGNNTSPRMTVSPAEMGFAMNRSGEIKKMKAAWWFLLLLANLAGSLPVQKQQKDQDRVTNRKKELKRILHSFLGIKLDEGNNPLFSQDNRNQPHRINMVLIMHDAYGETVQPQTLTDERIRDYYTSPLEDDESGQ